MVTTFLIFQESKPFFFEQILNNQENTAYKLHPGYQNAFLSKKIEKINSVINCQLQNSFH